MTWCKQAGIPHSEFKSWDAEDQSKALAFLIEENAKCGMCGTAEWEWEPELGGNRRAYEPVEQFCMGCYLKSVADEGSKLPGTTVSLMPTSSQQYAKMITDRKRAAYRG
jgi:hypothetical protein